MDKFVSCIVAAGGSGSRMKSDVNKIFLKICEVPVIAHTLNVLQNSNFVSEIIVSAREEDIVRICQIAEGFNITKLKAVVRGGATRGESVLCAKEEVSESADIIMVHDAARPLVSEEIIENTVASALQNGAAACGVKPKCTLKSVTAGGFVADTVDREKTVEIQTPQAFKKELFDEMYSFCTDIIKASTDDCMLAERCGVCACVTEGSYRNIKITTPEDLEIAEMLLRRR